MRIIPVLDRLGSQVVRGVRRMCQAVRQIQKCLKSEPVQVAE
jgi:hypothetical protein